MDGLKKERFTSGEVESNDGRRAVRAASSRVAHGCRCATTRLARGGAKRAKVVAVSIWPGARFDQAAAPGSSAIESLATPSVGKVQPLRLEDAARSFAHARSAAPPEL